MSDNLRVGYFDSHCRLHCIYKMS